MIGAYEVGRLYPGAQPPLQPSVRYQYRSGEHTLLIIADNLTAQEIDDARRGEAQFAVAQVERIVFVLWRLGDAWRWSDCSYSWHLEADRDPSQSVPPDEPSDESRALMQIVLVAAETGLIQVLRAVTLSPHLTRAMHTAVRAEAAGPWAGAAEYDQRLHRVYARYTTRDLLGAASAKCRGGE